MTSDEGDVLDLDRPSAVHIVGIGGAGMSAIAEVLAAMGHRVSGSDLRRTATLDRLEALGVEVHVGHDAAHIDDADAVTISTAIAEGNPEVVEARRRGIPVFRRSDTLAAISRTRRTIAPGRHVGISGSATRV